MNQNELRVKGARHHNLKNINVNIPKNKIIVISGLSGSGNQHLHLIQFMLKGRDVM